MAGKPWEKYGSVPQSSGGKPWEKYASQSAPSDVPSKVESFERGALNGATFGQGNKLVGAEGVLLDKLGRVGIDPIESTHPEAQAKIDAIAEQYTPSASEVYNKTKAEEDFAEDNAAKTNPMSYYGGYLAPGLATLGPSAGKTATSVVGNVAEKIGQSAPSLSDLVKTAVSFNTHPGSTALSVAKKVLSPFAEKFLAKQAAKVGVDTVAEAATPIAEAVTEAAPSAKKYLDPFLKIQKRQPKLE